MSLRRPRYMPKKVPLALGVVADAASCVPLPKTANHRSRRARGACPAALRIGVVVMNPFDIVGSDGVLEYVEDQPSTSSTSYRDDRTADVGVPAFTQPFDVARRLNQAIWVYDIDRCRVVMANDAALQIWQAESEADLAQRDLSKDMSTTVARRLKQYQSGFRENDATFSELWTLYPNGKPVSLDVIYTGYRLPDGRIAMLCEATRLAETTPETLRSAEALLHTDVMIALFAVSGPELYMNPAARNAWSSDTMQLQDLFINEREFDAILSDLKTRGEIRKVARVKTNDGWAWHDMSFKRCLDAATGQPATLVTSIDVTELKRARDRASYLANRDQLTGSYNRAYFQRKLDILDRAPREHPIALLYLDLDRFKQINDKYGHEAGDRLLLAATERIERCLTVFDMFARIGGDEFVVLLSAQAQATDFEARVDQLRAEVSQPFFHNNTKIDITTSIGVAIIEPQRTSHQAVRQADIALYEAKRTGRDRCAYYDDEMGRVAYERLLIESELAQALERDEFRLHLQPCVNLTTGAVIYAEALVRWHHPERGIIMPHSFIDICEETGLIEQLGNVVLKQGCALVGEWRRRGLNIGIAINVSPRQFLDDTFLSSLTCLAKAPDFEPGTVELEITESILAGDHNTVADRLRQITDLGYRISVDDFGTGYSNLAYISKFPLSCIKIDKSFIDSMPDSLPVMTLIQTLSEQIGARTVAEGVETPEQLKKIQDIGCHHIQGFFFSKPVPPDAFLTTVDRIQNTHRTDQAARHADTGQR